jgi:hypothetical protein
LGEGDRDLYDKRSDVMTWDFSSTGDPLDAMTWK